jgi:hypothetical protein
LNPGRLAHTSFSVHTIVHHTYQGILIQNPCRQKFATNTTQHIIKQLHYSTPTTMSNAKKMMMNLGKLQSNKYGKREKTAARREIPETMNEDAIVHYHHLLWKLL